MALKRGHLTIDDLLNDTSTTRGGDEADAKDNHGDRPKTETAEDVSDDKEDWRVEYEAQRAI